MLANVPQEFNDKIAIVNVIITIIFFIVIRFRIEFTFNP